jgi:transketolase
MKKYNQDALRQMANAIRFLSIDAVEKANSGHPGMPMGIADVATILFGEFLKFDAANPHWPDRDRFVLSAGHGSMLVYSLLYLTGYKDITLEDLKHFRQIHSKTAGHPEYGELDGIETTTGPLGQGLANAVGMALPEKMLAARFNKIVDHKTYCIVGDGCLMEGISQEAISLAGHLKLSKLIVLWDNNNISIDGKIGLSSSEDMKLRFKACGWKVLEIDGHNFDEIRKGLKQAQKGDQPVMISCKTTIAYGSPNKSGSEKSHGSPLGAEEIKLVRKQLDWKWGPFEIPENLLAKWRELGARGKKFYKKWEKDLENLPEESKAEFKRLMKGELPDFKNRLEEFKQKIFFEKPKQPTRKSSGDVLEILTAEIPELIGGSADLTGSVNTKTSLTKSITKDDFSGRYIHYGIREHAMGAIMNGIALHKGFIPYSGTFLVFCDYMKPAIRLSALMKQQVIYVLTHDSIGLGEDGPTHQPIEHLASLRAIPNLNVFRPVDAEEVAGCYEIALKHKNTPSAMVLSRQNVGFYKCEYNREESCGFGGYVISDTALGIEPDVIIIATGSEMGIALESKEKLHQHGLAVKVVSMPCFEIFEKQSNEYKNRILGPKKALRVGIEAGVSQGWDRYLGDGGIFVGMNSFGASGKAEDLYTHFGITAENVVEKVVAKLKAPQTDLLDESLNPLK